MEIVKSRYGVERSIERINLNKVRVLGESQFIRKSTNKQVISQCLILKEVLVIHWVVNSFLKK